MPPSHEFSVGIDFGTSNTVVAIAGPDGQVEALTFEHGGESLKVYVTALCFWDERHGNGLRTQVEGGPWAIEQFLEGLHAHRFIQSFKTFAASPSFKETRIFRERYAFEDLLSAFLRTLARHGGSRLDWGARNVIIGRPVQFAGYNPDDALAMQRYRAAFGRLGAEQARYVYEPVGAAFFYARQLDHDATVLVADFGGGTSDFSVMRFSRAGGVLRAEPLGHAGIGLAGDAFDYRIVDHVVSPRLGKGGHYRSMGKTLSIPNHYYANFARWNQLAMMKGSGDLKELRELARTALDPEPLEKFIDIIEYDLGFALYRAVSSAKMALSSREETQFRFQGEGIDIQARITRAEFESWIEEDVARIAATVDEALARADVRPEQIERVFLTGGTSFVPAIRRLFVERFGDSRLTSADQFESIAYGLALIGQSEDPGRWSVAS
ncbi:Hsp70 family protein [Microvirga arsenatis]|uniref:Hsp70 family protein n=1 Tax=Microvirga arsenatis TaxID=2692265 RepID=A0ABW9YU86_9HYPH|nr:Hsp70 family protein [Microvirga arsenatis]NBJ09754.1 Hsp70 family protein [Microvirga arsenatis]NBJ23387.1 Hsp70 family protein [Microvirga arsenatis]